MTLAFLLHAIVAAWCGLLIWKHASHERNVWIQALGYLIGTKPILDAATSIVLAFPANAFGYDEIGSPSDVMFGAVITSLWNVVFFFAYVWLTERWQRRSDTFYVGFADPWVQIGFIVYTSLALVVTIIWPLGIYATGFVPIAMGDGYGASIDTETGSAIRMYLLDIPAMMWPAVFYIIWERMNRVPNSSRYIVYALLLVCFGGLVVRDWSVGMRGKTISYAGILWLTLATLHSRRTATIVIVAIGVIGVWATPRIAELRAQMGPGMTAQERIAEMFRFVRDESGAESDATGALFDAAFGMSPIAQPGRLARSTTETGSYAGLKPLIGAAVGFVPRSVWPSKPQPGSIGATLADSAPYITARLFGNSIGTGRTAAAGTAWWHGGIVALILEAVLAAATAAWVGRVGSGNRFLGICSLAVFGSTDTIFFDLPLDRVILLFAQRLAWFGVLLVACTWVVRLVFGGGHTASSRNAKSFGGRSRPGASSPGETPGKPRAQIL